MKIDIIQKNGNNIARLVSDEIEIKDVQSALDLMAACYTRQATRLIMSEKNIVPEFFDLRTGILGEILQKFATYDFRIAIVGDFSRFTSKNFQDFLYESNKTGRMIFIGSAEEAEEKLA